jgi:hypothetical protein
MKRCPACQRTYTDETLSFCLDDGSTLYNATGGSTDLAATLIIPDPRLTAPVNQDTFRQTPPPRTPQPLSAPLPRWQPPPVPQTFQPAQARQGRGLALTSLIFGIAAFLLLGFCIIGGATGVEESLIGGIFLFSLLLALAGAVLGIIATSKSTKDQGATNIRTMSIIALVINALFLLITVIFLILGAVASKSTVSPMMQSVWSFPLKWYI